jgi:hypothetical protein
MNTLTKTISTELDSLKRRLVKVLRYGKSDVQTCIQALPYGVDSNPIKDMVAVYCETSEKGKVAIVGYFNKNQLAEVGEYRTFSTDENGVVKFYTWLKNDGTMEIGGDTNFAVKYNELKSEYDKTKTYLTTLKTATGAIATALDALIPGTSTAFNLAMTGQTVGDFSLTKNEKIKTIG